MPLGLPRLHQEVIGSLRDDLSVLLLCSTVAVLSSLLLGAWVLRELLLGVVAESCRLAPLVVLSVDLLVSLWLSVTIASLPLLQALVLPLNEVLHFFGLHILSLCFDFSYFLY